MALNGKGRNIRYIILRMRGHRFELQKVRTYTVVVKIQFVLNGSNCKSTYFYCNRKPSICTYRSTTYSYPLIQTRNVCIFDRPGLCKRKVGFPANASALCEYVHPLPDCCVLIPPSLNEYLTKYITLLQPSSSQNGMHFSSSGAIP